MTKRNLRTVPAALLMTTALSWALPALAQTGTAPARPASAAPSSSQGRSTGLHPDGQLVPPGPAVGGAAAATGSGTPPGAGANGLPPGFQPAMPGQRAASAPAGAASAAGDTPRPTTRP